MLRTGQLMHSPPGQRLAVGRPNHNKHSFINTFSCIADFSVQILGFESCSRFRVEEVILLPRVRQAETLRVPYESLRGPAAASVECRCCMQIQGIYQAYIYIILLLLFYSIIFLCCVTNAFYYLTLVKYTKHLN